MLVQEEAEQLSFAFAAITDRSTLS